MGCLYRCCSFFLCLFALPLMASDTNTTLQQESPWLLTPLLSSSPKMGTSVGALSGYLHKFDEHSPASTFALGGSYSSSDSYVTAIGANLYFDKDRQRLIAGLIKGKINNEYNDFLGTGLPISSTDDLNALFARYTHRFGENWFIGAQGIKTDYAIIGDNLFSSTVLGFLGLYGFKSNGIGIVVHRDSRDNQNSPVSGASLQFYNFAYRKALGGDESFDVYSLQYRAYLEHLSTWVMAMRVDNRWSVNAPAGAYSSINLPGYTMGQYLGPHSTILEAEERIPLISGFGLNTAVGIGCLYGGDKSCSDSKNLFPSASVGLSYLIKQKEKMVVRVDAGAGKNGNFGFYLKFGHPF